jgi:hypothetical protein
MVVLRIILQSFSAAGFGVGVIMKKKKKEANDGERKSN